MRIDSDTPATAVIDRRSTTWLAWAAIGALLATLTLEAREVARRDATPAPVIEVEASSRVITGIPLDDLALTAAVVMPLRSGEGRTAPANAVVGSSPTVTAARDDERGLIGMKATTLRATLGAPDFVRRDGRSQMWRYGSGACTLTVFLHGEEGGLAVEHVEGRGLRNLRDTGADCGERVVGERRPADLPG